MYNAGLQKKKMQLLLENFVWYRKQVETALENNVIRTNKSN